VLPVFEKNNGLLTEVQQPKTTETLSFSRS
jgi:hypothetical protein